LQASIGQLEQLLTPLLHTPLQSLNKQLPPVQAAKLQAALAYTTNALFLCQCNRQNAIMRWACVRVLGGPRSSSLCFVSVSPAPLHFPVYLHSSGEPTEKHPVRKELVRPSPMATAYWHFQHLLTASAAPC